MSENLYLVFGEETYFKNEFVQDLKVKTVGADDMFMNAQKLEGKDITFEQLETTIETYPMFADQKFVHIKDSGLFASGRKADTEKLVAWLDKIPSHAVVVFDETSVDSRMNIVKKFKSNHGCKEFKYLNPSDIEKKLLAIAVERNKKIDSTTLQYFISCMSQDFTKVTTEFDKLLSYEDNITKEVVDEICCFSIEKKIYELSKAVANRNGEFALKFFNELISSKESPFGILSLLNGEYRKILTVKYLEAKKANSKEILAKVKIPPFALKDISKVSKMYTFSQLEEILDLCLEADMNIKQGLMSPEDSVETLILNCLNM